MNYKLQHLKQNEIYINMIRHNVYFQDAYQINISLIVSLSWQVFLHKTLNEAISQ